MRYRFCRIGFTLVAPPFAAPTACTDKNHALLQCISSAVQVLQTELHAGCAPSCRSDRMHS